MNTESEAMRAMSPRKALFRDLYDGCASERAQWIERSRGFHEAEWRYMRFLAQENLRVLDLGCGAGHLLAALKPSYGVGVDLSPAMIAEAHRLHPDLHFIAGDAEDPALLASLHGPFDVIILSDTIGFLDDCQETLERLHSLCTRDTRLIIAYYNQFWRPILWLAERVGRKMPEPAKNWLSLQDLERLLSLADYEVIKHEWRQIAPIGRSAFMRGFNAVASSLPLLRHLSLRNYIVVRPLRDVKLSAALSASVVIPCRNERGNIEAAIRRLPRFCDDLEVIFVEGHSSDGTYEECLRVQEAHRNVDIKVMRQPGKGKGDAVRAGFAAARGDVLIILDADLTVPPETMPKFFIAIASGKGNFVNGTRLVYPMESGAMRFLNYLANRAFALIFSWLLNQRFTDTLCGTKALTRSHYAGIEAGRAYFGDFDPFGDFDLIFGAAKQNLKIVEIPVRYADRVYGSTQISRFRHGALLTRMVVFAFRKLKAV